MVGLALTYFFIYVVRQGVTSWFVFYLLQVGGWAVFFFGGGGGQAGVVGGAVPVGRWVAGGFMQAVSDGSDGRAKRGLAVPAACCLSCGSGRAPLPQENRPPTSCVLA